MSAVRKEQIVYRFPEPEEEREKEKPEPKFMPVDAMMELPFDGPHEYTEEQLRSMWSRIWRCFKSEELCKGFIKYHKCHSIELWEAAFEEVRVMKNEKFKYIRYVKKVADGFAIRGTPKQIAEREAKELEARLAMRPTKQVEIYKPSEKVRQLWAEKGKTRSLDEIPDDHPRVVRMAKILKGDGRK